MIIDIIAPETLDEGLRFSIEHAVWQRYPRAELHFKWGDGLENALPRVEVYGVDLQSWVAPTVRATVYAAISEFHLTRAEAC